MKNILFLKWFDNQQPSLSFSPSLKEQSTHKLWQVFSITWYTLVNWRVLRQKQRTRMQLWDLTDEQLKDIGYTQREAEIEARKNFWQ
jgi:uncharacterized protein YjiS (DUF1127 family)